MAVRKVLDGTSSGRRKRRRLDPDIHDASDEGDEEEGVSGEDNDEEDENEDMASTAAQVVPHKSAPPAAPPTTQPKPALGSALKSGDPPRVVCRKQKTGTLSRKLVCYASPPFASPRIHKTLVI